MSRNQTLRAVQALTAFFRLVFDYEKYEMKPAFPYFKDIFLIAVRSLPVVIPNRTDGVEYPNKRTLR